MRILKYMNLSTPLGDMVAAADENALYLLAFTDQKKLNKMFSRLKQKNQAALEPGQTKPLRMIEKELQDYFDQRLKQFNTPLYFSGTPFQKRVWSALKTIPFGKTFSYAALAASIGYPTAFRAVANANGANLLSIILPCHRVISTDGSLGGYSNGLERKSWLLAHESEENL